MDAAKTGALIAQARKEKDLTQGQLAQRLHVSVQAVSKWERGRNFPDLALLEPLAEALDLTVSELLAGERGEPPRESTVREALALGVAQLKKQMVRWRGVVACLLLIALSFGLGMPVYTYDYPDRGIQLGILGWFGVANAQSAIVLVLGAPLLLWGYRSGKLWVFTLCAAGGFSLLYFTGTRLTYFGAILLAGGFFVLVLLGRKRWVFCLPLAVALALLVAFQGMSPMAARQAMSVDSDSYYEELTQQYLGEDSDFVYREGEEIPPEVLEKIRALYTEVYGKRGIYNTMLLGDLIQEFGVDRVMEEYGYTVDGELLYDVRDKKLHALHLVWEDQDLFTHLFGFEYAKAQIGVTNYDPENDFPALRYFYGYVGAALYVGYCLYFPLLALWHLVRKLRSFFSYPWVEAGTYLAMLAFGFGAAQFSGQVLRKPSVTVYLSLAAALLLGLFSREREPLEKGKEPVVLPGKM